jgi:hypothetical protein
MYGTSASGVDFAILSKCNEYDVLKDFPILATVFSRTNSVVLYPGLLIDPGRSQRKFLKISRLQMTNTIQLLLYFTTTKLKSISCWRRCLSFGERYDLEKIATVKDQNE